MKIAILGDGAWGTACATLFAHNGFDVILWCFNKEVVKNIQKFHMNNIFLPNIPLSNKIYPTIDLKYAINNCDMICEAIPVKFLRSIILESNEAKKNNVPWLILSKGIESDTLFLPSQILEDILGPINYAVLSGPSFAIDLANKQITAVNLSSKNSDLLNELQKILNNKFFTTRINHDPIGTQLCGALKNIVAFTIGMLDAANYTDNTKAFIITQFCKEITTLVKLIGGLSETVYDLAGIGDIILTSMSNKSKNYNLGQKVFKVKSFNKIHQENLPEGFNTIKSIKKIIDKHKAQTPLFCNIYEIFSNDKIEIEKLFNNIL